MTFTVCQHEYKYSRATESATCNFTEFIIKQLDQSRHVGALQFIKRIGLPRLEENLYS